MLIFVHDLILDGDTLCDDVESPPHDGSTGGPEVAALDLTLSNTTHNEAENKMASEETEVAVEGTKMADPTNVVSESEVVEKPVEGEDANIAECKVAPETAQDASIDSPEPVEPTTEEMAKDSEAQVEGQESEKLAEKEAVEKVEENLENAEEEVKKTGEDMTCDIPAESAEQTQKPAERNDRWVLWHNVSVILFTTIHCNIN